MALYHLDVAGRLRRGLKIELRSLEDSMFGRNYRQRFKLLGLSSSLESGKLPGSLANIDQATFREFATEFVRLHHPRLKSTPLPSRLSSFFAVSSVEDCELYAQRHEYRGELRVYRILTKAECFPSFDMLWLDRHFPKALQPSVIYHLEKYWSGVNFDVDPDVAPEDPRRSLRAFLVSTSITVGDRVV